MYICALWYNTEHVRLLKTLLHVVEL